MWTEEQREKYKNNRNQENLKHWRRVNLIRNQKKINARQREIYHANKDRLREKRAENYQIRKVNIPLSKALLRGAKNRSRQFDVPFNLSIEDIIVPKKCPVLGFLLNQTIGTTATKNQSPSVDRIIPKLGYVKGNIQVISYRANVLKKDASLWELEQLVKYVRRETKRREKSNNE